MLEKNLKALVRAPKQRSSNSVLNLKSRDVYLHIFDRERLKIRFSAHLLCAGSQILHGRAKWHFWRLRNFTYEFSNNGYLASFAFIERFCDLHFDLEYAGYRTKALLKVN